MGSLVEGNFLKGRYEIYKILSEDMGQTIYFAKDRLNKNASIHIRELDIKTKSGKVFTLEAVENLVSIISKLSHNNIPKFIEFFSTADNYYIVEEYIEGNYIEELLQAREKPFTFKEAYYWMVDLLDVLHYLHGLPRPVIVRGINPVALKVTVTGDIKLVDFSMARFYSESKELDTLFVWNPGYTSPEQYGTQKSEIASDIYSFGATFYHIFTMQEVGSMNFSFPPVSQFNDTFTPEQDAFIAKCIAKDLNVRYRSAFAAKQALMSLSPFLPEKQADEDLFLYNKKSKGLLGFVKSIFGRKK